MLEFLVPSVAVMLYDAALSTLLQCVFLPGAHLRELLVCKFFWGASKKRRSKRDLETVQTDVFSFVAATNHCLSHSFFD